MSSDQKSILKFNLHLPPPSQAQKCMNITKNENKITNSDEKSDLKIFSCCKNSNWVAPNDAYNDMWAEGD